MSRDNTDISKRTHDEALAWIARLRSDVASEEDRQAFALWLARDPSHRQAMDKALELWDDLGSVRHLPFQSVTRLAANHPSWWAGAALAACLVLAIFLWPGFTSDSDPLNYQTSLGERFSAELEDGSRLTLNTSSRVQVSYDEDQRHLELLRGEVFFEVASDPQRPFHVDTGSARITAIGTAFNIYRADASTAITVTKGVVRVTELGVTGNRVAASEVLHANQQLRASAAGLHGAATVNPGRQLAWQRGELVAEGMRMPDFAAELERYHDIRILIGDAEVAAMTVWGVFELDDEPHSILRALELTHDLQLVQLDEQTIRLLKPAQ